MSLRKLPDLQSFNLPKVCAFQTDEEALDKWNASLEASQTTENTISILDVIGEDFWTGGGFTSKRMSAALRSIGSKDVFVDINSPGGDFFEGVAIYNMLRAHPAKVTVRILGMAASAASVIAMAGDEIQIGKAGFLMIHNAWVYAVGNRHDLAAAAKEMEPFDDAMATVYSDRAGIEKKQAAAWMDAETWFNGEQAISAKLADAYLAADQVKEGTKATETAQVKAVRRIDAMLAKQGIPRSERRSLIGEMKGGTPDAAATSTHDAADMVAALQRLSSTLKS